MPNQDINMNNGEGRELKIGSGWKGLRGSADKTVNEESVKVRKDQGSKRMRRECRK